MTTIVGRQRGIVRSIDSSRSHCVDLGGLAAKGGLCAGWEEEWWPSYGHEFPGRIALVLDLGAARGYSRRY